MTTWHRIALTIAIIGAINWGLIGFFQYDLVAALFGGGEQTAALARTIYAIVGIAGLFLIPLLFRDTEETYVPRAEPRTNE
ncbi:hypothetical protein EDD68_13810 [Melghiribacillus thermohalophilus]|uniref:DUF378 domain-containing protein n=1 Tax=Melghiribacillus thermohalophilus TaxID=1324956 RepID=A0A4R3ML00_9BACI|nr:DUF378 domain-containing protein [Melghiribacillus thermohalophilus]TCT15099.1 hypothetical protein EDD68_13810 [Melghiribacillus thermohalophilus]